MSEKQIPERHRKLWESDIPGRHLIEELGAVEAKVSELKDLLLCIRNYAAGESPDVELKTEVQVFGMICDLIDQSGEI